jgi:hypothetical protein
MMSRKEPKWFDRWLAERRAEEEDAYYESLVPYKRMSVYAFIEKATGSFLAELFSAEAPLAECRRFEDDLRGAIVTAHASGEPWVRDNPPPPSWSQWPAFRDQLYLDLDPRAAARWLLSNPMYQHLVPPEWARVVLRDANIKLDVTVVAAATEKPLGCPCGPKPKKRNLVLRELRKMPLNQVRAMQEKDMEARFGVSRFTCRAARRILELEPSRSD